MALIAYTLAGRRAVVVTGLAAAVPVAAALVRALADSWTPEGDRAVVATRAYDVLTAHSPLVGAFSTSTAITGETTYSPGPLLYWLLALPARIPGEVALPLVMSVFNAACAIAIVALAHRRGGRVLMVVAGAGVALLWASLPAALPYDIWAPAAPVMPFALLVWTSWSIACGDVRLLPAAVLLSSFAVQCHLAYVLPVLAGLGVAVLGLVLRRRVPSRRVLVMTGLVAVACWSFPVLDQILAWAQDDRGPGNVAALVDAARSRGETAGGAAGLRAAVRAIGVPPWWLRRAGDPAERTFEVFRSPGAVAVSATALILAGLIVALVGAWRRRRQDVVAACALALALCAALVVVTASFPEKEGTIFSLSYALWWAAPVGMWTWLALGWSVAALWAPQARLEALAARCPASLGMALVVAAAVSSAVRVDHRPGDVALNDAVRTVVREVERAVPADAAIRVNGPAFGFEAAVVLALRRGGATVGTDQLARELGPAYAPEGRVFSRVLEIHDGYDLAPGARLVTRVTLRERPGEPPRTVTVGMQRRVRHSPPG